MTITDRDIEIIESYFNRTLSKEDNQAFEQRLQTDSDFKKAVNEYQATTAILNTVREREQKAFLKNIEATMPPVGIPIRRLDFRWRAIAAVGLVLVTVGVWQFWGGGDEGVKLKSIAVNYFEPYPSYNTTKGFEQKDKKTEAFEAYDAQKYKSAAKLFEAAFNERGDTMLLFYRGIAELGSGAATQSEAHLEKLQGSSIIPQQALFYYLGLAAIENGQTEKAILYLKKVADTEGSYQNTAKSVLSALESKK